MDVLSDLLQRSRARGAAFSRTTMYGDWCVQFPVGGTLAIHSIIDGDLEAWTVDAPDASIRVIGGDLILLRSTPHLMASDATAPPQPLPDSGGSRSASAGNPGEGRQAQFFCGAYVFDGDLSKSLLDALPPIARIRPRAGSALRSTLDLLIAQVEVGGAGQQVLLDRLLDAVLVLALREWFAAAQSTPRWISALDDPALAPALQAIHTAPERTWTVATLAGLTHQSRSGFARRFTDTIGVPPLTYLADWRMSVAKEALRDTGDSIATIAASVGYSSEYSFATAFKRHTGQAPGRWRSIYAAAA
ncbi:AraC family transcriptional regulator [Branchiibius hedensis]|uniref:AraC-type DNA-binding protein n=1 Tax=Branchiibius hedensis TaxID=672460 RepID=A0A2Y8ZL56_9MICO|nr:AraC family transcriptional regulator [Branchiibius hedensis]PWJ24253.1 AraC family transcriptional regulator [Branchiibius hedensis]SSA33070.1 AraC-type DNA-binding protein [Branchiibius hedensis]